MIGQVVLGVSSLVGSETSVGRGVKDTSQSRSNQWKIRDDRQVNNRGKLSVSLYWSGTYSIQRWVITSQKLRSVSCDLQVLHSHMKKEIESSQSSFTAYDLLRTRGMRRISVCLVFVWSENNKQTTRVSENTKLSPKTYSTCTCTPVYLPTGL